MVPLSGPGFVLYKGGGDRAGAERKADIETPTWGFTSVNRRAKTSERASSLSFKPELLTAQSQRSFNDFKDKI